MKKVISVLLILLPTLFFGVIDKPTQMAIVLFAGFASAVIINIEEFESFKAWKLEAKLRKANKVIDEASATIEQLESVTKPLLKSNLILLLHDGSFDGMGIEDKENIFLELLKIKQELKISSIDEYINRAANGVANHHFHELYRAADTMFRETFDKFTTIYYAPETPSLEEVERYFKNNPAALTDEVKVKLNRFNEFKKEFL